LQILRPAQIASASCCPQPHFFGPDKIGASGGTAFEAFFNGLSGCNGVVEVYGSRANRPALQPSQITALQKKRCQNRISAARFFWLRLGKRFRANIDVLPHGMFPQGFRQADGTRTTQRDLNDGPLREANSPPRSTGPSSDLRTYFPGGPLPQARLLFGLGPSLLTKDRPPAHSASKRG